MPGSKMVRQAETKLPENLSERVFGLNKAEINAIEVLGFQLFEQGRNKEAETIFQGLIAIDKSQYQGYAGMGALALAEKKLDEAAAWLSQALERNGKDPTVHANLGETLMRLGRFESASAEFEKAFKLDPSQKDPGANRARAILLGMKTTIEGLQQAPHEKDAA